MSDKVKTIYSAGEKEKENQQPKKPGVIKTGSEKPKVKITGPGAKVVASVLLLLAMVGSLFAQPGIITQPGTQPSVFTNRLLTTLNGSGVTNRIYFTNAANVFGNTNAIHIRSNSTAQRWEWHTDWTTVVGTNTANRPTGTWRAAAIGAALYGQTRYDPRSPQTLPDAPASTAPNPSFVLVQEDGSITNNTTGNAATATSADTLSGVTHLWHNESSSKQTSLSAAKAAAVAGDLIETGIRTSGATNLLKNGVDYLFKGSVLTLSNQVQNGAGLAYGVLDDRGQGPITNTVKGIKKITYFAQNAAAPDAVTETNIWNASALGAVVITNPASYFTLEADEIEATIYGSQNFSAGVLIADCAYSSGKIGRIYDPHINVTGYSGGLDEFDEPVILINATEGLYWERGESHWTIGRIETSSYAYYANDVGAGSDVVENMWLNSDYIFSKNDAAVYSVGQTINYRNWLNVKEISSAGNNGITLFGTQRFYLFGNGKISTTKHGGIAINLDASGAPEAWINSQKIVTTNGNFVLLGAVGGGFLDLTCQQFEDLGSNGNAIGFRTESGTNNIHGGRAKIKAGKGIAHTGGRTHAKNLTLDTCTTTNTANNPVFVSADGLILENTSLIAPAGVACVQSTNAQTVTVIGTLTVNTPNSPNITFVGGTVVTNAALPRL